MNLMIQFNIYMFNLYIYKTHWNKRLIDEMVKINHPCTAMLQMLEWWALFRHVPKVSQENHEKINEY